MENVNKQLLDALKEMVSIVEIHSEETDSNFAWAELSCARQAIAAAESVICTTGHNTEGRQWVLYKEQIAADPYLEDCIAHLEWRGIARRIDAEDGVTVIFKEKP